MDANGATGATYLNLDGQVGWNIQYDVVKMENQSPELNVSHSPAPFLNMVQQSYSTPALLEHHQPAQSTSQTAAMNGNNIQKKGPYLRIVEQPAKNDQRFRYVVEGRSAGSIKGVNFTTENNTYPTIEIVNYNKQVVVVVSCVTKDEPYRPHPHKVVGRDGGGQKYKDGICELTLNEPPFRASFSNLGIQCTKKKDMEEALEERRRKKVNPFNTPYTKDQKNDYALHEVRLCFQAFINPTGVANGWKPLEPVVSDPIIDKKAISELVICQLCSCSAKVNGGDRKILLCDKVDKNDIKVKFTEFDSQGGVKWQAYADFQPQDIHKQTAIAFNTPRYERTDISDPVKVFIQLERPSDKTLSKPVEFQFFPDPDSFKRKRLRTSDDVRDYMRLQTNGQFPTASTNGYTNPFSATPELKVEQMTSPEYYGNQNSPYSMVTSPSPQSPPTMGLQYLTVSPTPNSNNPFLPSAQINQLPAMSGGSFTPIGTEHTANSNIPSNHANQINQINQQEPADSSEMTSEGRLINRLASQVEEEANVHAMTNYFFNILNPVQPEAVVEEEGLTTSGLLNLLGSTDLVQIENL